MKPVDLSNKIHICYGKPMYKERYNIVYKSQSVKNQNEATEKEKNKEPLETIQFL